MKRKILVGLVFLLLAGAMTFAFIDTGRETFVDPDSGFSDDEYTSRTVERGWPFTVVTEVQQACAGFCAEVEYRTVSRKVSASGAIGVVAISAAVSVAIYLGSRKLFH